MGTCVPTHVPMDALLQLGEIADAASALYRDIGWRSGPWHVGEVEELRHHRVPTCVDLRRIAVGKGR